MTRRLHRLMLIAGMTSAVGPGVARSQFTTPDTVGINAMQQPVRQPGIVRPGDTIRLSSTEQGALRGVLVAADSERLVVSTGNTREPLPVARARIATAEVLRGRRRRGLRALGAGAAVGSLLGIGIFAVAIGNRSSNSDGIEGAIGVLLGATAAVAGTLVGGVVALTHTDQWIHFDPATLAIIPDGG